MNAKVQVIPISEIRILNPRHRSQEKFAVIVESIKNVGLKKPIRVSRHLVGEERVEGDREFDLVCGQGRIEAFIRLGWTEIPAIVEDVSKEDRLLMSLVENMARRFPSHMDLAMEIMRLKESGLSNVQIGMKIGIADTTVGGLIVLFKAGEERLLTAALMGKIPLGIAIDIAKAESPDMQRELLKAYQGKEINQRAIRSIKRLVEQRHLFGKKRGRNGVPLKDKQNSAENLVNTYRREAMKQKAMIKKNKLCETRLVFVKTALKQLMANTNFRNLLKAEGLTDMPKFLRDQIRPT